MFERAFLAFEDAGPMGTPVAPRAQRRGRCRPARGTNEQRTVRMKGSTTCNRARDLLGCGPRGCTTGPPPGPVSTGRRHQGATYGQNEGKHDRPSCSRAPRVWSALALALGVSALSTAAPARAAFNIGNPFGANTAVTMYVA